MSLDSTKFLARCSFSFASGAFLLVVCSALIVVVTMTAYPYNTAMMGLQLFCAAIVLYMTVWTVQTGKIVLLGGLGAIAGVLPANATLTIAEIFFAMVDGFVGAYTFMHFTFWMIASPLGLILTPIVPLILLFLPMVRSKATLKQRRWLIGLSLAIVAWNIFVAFADVDTRVRLHSIAFALGGLLVLIKDSLAWQRIVVGIGFYLVGVWQYIRISTFFTSEGPHYVALLLSMVASTMLMATAFSLFLTWLVAHKRSKAHAPATETLRSIAGNTIDR